LTRPEIARFCAATVADAGLAERETSHRFARPARHEIILDIAELDSSHEDGKMSKKDLIDAVAKECELTKEKAGVAVDAALAHIREALKNGEEVRIPDFGTFKVAKRKAREGRNPATGATINIPASRVPKFSPSKGLKDALN
jgi:DNA-binding protein HU-beta